MARGVASSARWTSWAFVLAQFGLIGALLLTPTGDLWTLPGWLDQIGTVAR